MSFQIKLPVFEGPFDLLLFFIERDELDIYNIPISKITNDFLDYIHQLEEMNIDVAGEFISVAASLMRIKAKMLLPRKELDALGNEIDPREELTRKLLEYRKFKEVIETFSELEDLRRSQFERGSLTYELKSLADKALIESEWESLTLFKLFKAFEKAMDRFEKKQNAYVHQIRQYNYSIQGQQEFVLNKIKGRKKAGFDQLFESLENRIHAIVTFLAILELLNLQKIQIKQGEGVNSFWILPAEEN
jgi:segregation and condensation protein A